MSFVRQIAWIPMLLLPLLTSGQDDVSIFFVNPSFEDLPKCCEAPSGWYNCGKTEESPPDIQPGQFQVTKAPQHGETYLGLVVRDNDTWEAVGQRLARPLEQGKCYEFDMDICRAELYLSLSRTTGEEANYTIPAKLRIYGGTGYCDKRELLYETSVVTNTRWLTQTFRIQPKNGSYTYILFEAYYKTPTLFPYNGNILIDNASPIKQVPCKEPIAKKDPEPAPPKKPVAGPAPTPAPTPAPQPAKGSMDRSRIKKGDIIRLDKIYFEANKFEITDGSLPALEEVFNFLRENSDVVVEIGGHTNNRPSPTYAESLSTNRAKAVADWLVSRGIPSARVQYKGYGKTMPIQTNETPEGRKANQRVEIKILNMN